MNSEYVNAFLVSAASVLQTACGLALTLGKPYVKTNTFEDNVLVICIGITGQVKGQVLIAVDNEVACELASKMCMMPIDKLDEISLSALSELSNMILGNAATVLSTKGVTIDITPPAIIQGKFKMEHIYTGNICMPMFFDGDKLIEVDIALKED